MQGHARGWVSWTSPSLPSSWRGLPHPSSSQLADPLVSPVSSPDLWPLWYVDRKPLLLLTGYAPIYTVCTHSGLFCCMDPCDPRSQSRCRQEQVNSSVLRTGEVSACLTWDLPMHKSVEIFRDLQMLLKCGGPTSAAANPSCRNRKGKLLRIFWKEKKNKCVFSTSLPHFFYAFPRLVSSNLFKVGNSTWVGAALLWYELNRSPGKGNYLF